MLKGIVRNRSVWSFNCVCQQNVFTHQIFSIYGKNDLALKNQ